MLVKLYGEAPDPQKRYSPSKLVGADKTRVVGYPDERRVSTSYVERQNLTMPMSMRRFTRLTNGFSKKVANHEHAIALDFMHYNFVRIHRSLRVTPAMETGISDHLWAIGDLVGLLSPLD